MHFYCIFPKCSAHYSLICSICTFRLLLCRQKEFILSFSQTSLSFCHNKQNCRCYANVFFIGLWFRISFCQQRKPWSFIRTTKQYFNDKCYHYYIICCIFDNSSFSYILLLHIEAWAGKQGLFEEKNVDIHRLW